MASIVVSPIVTGKKSALVANTETKEEKINFEIFSEKPNLLEYSFSFLHGYEVAQLGTISKHINWRSRTEYLWIELYGNEFGNYKHVFKNHNNLSKYNKYRRAYLSFQLRHSKYYQISNGHSSRTDPIERQGSSGCIVTTIPHGVFCIVGGWTTRGLSVGVSLLRDLPITTTVTKKTTTTTTTKTTTTNNGAEETLKSEKKATSNDESSSSSSSSSSISNSFVKSKYEWQTYNIQNRGRENATYGHSITHIPPGVLHPNAEGMIMFGGVTMGGYRGEISSLTAITIHNEIVNDENKFKFLWKPITRNGRQHGAIARSYHTVNFVSNEMIKDGVHENHLSKLYIFGGFNMNGAIAEFQTAKLEMHPRTNEILVPTFDNNQPDGEQPCARFGHTCTYVKGQLYIAGGSTGSSNYKGQRDGEELQTELYILDLRNETLNWSHPEISFLNMESTNFRGLCRCHSAIELNGNILFSFGGPPNETTNHLHLLEVDNNTFQMQRVATVNEQRLPCARQNQTVAKLACGTRMVVFGGALALPYGNEELGDTWVLDFDGDETNRDVIEECEEPEEEEEEEEVDANDYGHAFQFPQQQQQGFGDLRQLLAMARRHELLRRMQAQQQGRDGSNNGEDDDDEDDDDEDSDDDDMDMPEGARRCAQQ